MQRRIDRHDVADLDHVLDIGMPGEVELLLDRLGKPVSLVIMKMHVEGLQSAQHRKADAAGRARADVHALDVIGPFDTVGDVPAALHHPLVGGNIVPHESEDHHHHMFGDADRIAVGDPSVQSHATQLTTRLASLIGRRTAFQTATSANVSNLRGADGWSRR